MNDILIVFYKDSTKECYSFPLGTEEPKALSLALNGNGFASSYINHKYIRQAPYPLDYYQHAPSEEYGRPDARKAIALKQIDRIKEYRNAFLQSLDAQFMRSLELDNPSMKNHIVKLKTFLRDLPRNLRFSRIEKEEDLLRYNPFNNITQLILTSTGGNYLTPPVVSVEPPQGKFFGFAPKATCFIKDGRVVKIEVTEFGCGYDSYPKIEIDPPKDKAGNLVEDSGAKAVCAPIELSIDSF